MNTHELANMLLKQSDKPFNISIDVSTSEEDANHRAFTTEFFEIIQTEDEATICFDGYLNGDK